MNLFQHLKQIIFNSWEGNRLILEKIIFVAWNWVSRKMYALTQLMLDQVIFSDQEIYRLNQEVVHSLTPQNYQYQWILF